MEKFTSFNLELKPITPWTLSMFAIYDQMVLLLSECGQDIAPSQTCTFKPVLGKVCMEMNVPLQMTFVRPFLAIFCHMYAKLSQN